MGKLITIIGPSGVGKTALVHALAQTGKFAIALEGHDERPFQALFKKSPHYGLANQIDYFLLRVEQERTLRTFPRIGLIDGGLDLDYQGSRVSSIAAVCWLTPNSICADGCTKPCAI